MFPVVHTERQYPAVAERTEREKQQGSAVNAIASTCYKMTHKSQHQIKSIFEICGHPLRPLSLSLFFSELTASSCGVWELAPTPLFREEQSNPNASRILDHLLFFFFFFFSCYNVSVSVYQRRKSSDRFVLIRAYLSSDMEESKAAVAKAQLTAEQEQNLPCPRCDSNNTKFCYYNNYSRSQPRYFCKDCRRYWTKGGTLRNIPVGAGTRKNSKRSYAAAAAAVKAKRRPCSPSSAPPSALSAIPLLQSDPLGVIYAPPDADHRLLDVISLAPSNGPFGSLLESFHWEASGAATSPNFGGLNPWIPAPGPELQSHSDSSAGGDENPAPPPEEDFLGLLGDPSCLAGEWPDPAMNTPGSSFQ